MKIAAVAVALAAALGAPASAELAASTSAQVVCVLCGDYTFDSQDGTPATYEGRKIWLCSTKTWPRRFFCGSEKSRAEFVKAPDRYLEEPYPV